MTPEVRKELNTVIEMVQRWKAFWLRQYRDPDTCPDVPNPNAWILDELAQLIMGGDYYHEGMVSSYVDRMHRAKLVTSEEREEFYEEIYGQLDDMRRQLHLPEPEQKTVAFPE